MSSGFPLEDRTVTPAGQPLPKRVRAAGGFLAIAAIVHVLAVPTTLLVLKRVVDATAGWERSWPQFFEAIALSGRLGIFIAMILGQFVFAFLAGIGASQIPRRWGMALVAVAVGVFAILYSILVFGGIVGALAGGWSVAGGVLGWPAARPYLDPRTARPPERPSWMAEEPYGPAPWTRPLLHRRRTLGRETRPEALVLVGAGVLHILSIPFSLLVLVRAYQAAHPNLYGLPWDRFFGMFTEDMGPLLLVAIAAQVGLAILAFLTSFLVLRGGPALGAFPLVIGIAAVAVSFLFFGGIFGIAGGALAIAGGFLALIRRRPEPETIPYGGPLPTGPPRPWAWPPRPPTP
ncbi:MAG: hypothetical protein A3K65_06880 [Euryarchaeota archaeon RBG_16_68_12]|nr:MAG: hypothetical protein A3K65_06880 [Euryarchaeota archaeon RBG_16_68_12]